MASLVAKTPCAGLGLPVSAGAVALCEAAPGHITSLMPGPDTVAASAALRAAHGMAFPGPGRATGREGARALWSGRGQALLLGPAPEPLLTHHFALTDQSDAWAAVSLEGSGAREVLARLCPLDLRDGHFKRGHSARSLIGHMNASLTRTGRDTWLILAMRSMATTLLHELGEAMRSVAAQNAP